MALPRDLRRQRQRSRALLDALSRDALEEAGHRLADIRQAEERELETISRHLPGALAGGLSVTEIAEITGLSRQKIYELRKRHTFADDDLQLRILIQLAAGGAQSAEGVAHVLDDVPPPIVYGALRQMDGAGLVDTVVTEYDGGSLDEWFAVTPTGQERLEALVKPQDEGQRMAVYAAIDPDERPKLERIAAQVLGPEWFAVIQPGTVTDQDWTELAFHVVAFDGPSAVARGRERLTELRRAAGVSDRPAVITAVAPADPWRPG
jgi:DNA-binding PadR family transcriptional regulator